MRLCFIGSGGWLVVRLQTLGAFSMDLFEEKAEKLRHKLHEMESTR